MLNLHDARKIVLRAIKAQIAVMLWGGPGIGKSSVLAQITAQLYDSTNNLIDIRLPQMEPTDLRGIPKPNEKSGRTDWYYPNFWPERGPDGKCTTGPKVLLFDEIEKAPVSVKNAALQIVLDRKVGDYVLPDDVAIVCAGNREDDGCFSAPMGAALNNRMIHVEVKQDIDVWARWAHENDVMEDVIAFLHFKPEALYNNTGENAFPSPRSWVMASKLLTDVTDIKEMKKLLAASVGEALVGEFVAWSQVYRDVHPEEVITKGKLPEFKNNEPSFRYAVAMAVALYARKKAKKQHLGNIAKFLDALPPDMRVIFLRQQKQNMLIEFAKDDRFNEIVAGIMDTFDM